MTTELLFLTFSVVCHEIQMFVAVLSGRVYQLANVRHVKCQEKEHRTAEMNRQYIRPHFQAAWYHEIMRKEIPAWTRRKAISSPLGGARVAKVFFSWAEE